MQVVNDLGEMGLRNSVYWLIRVNDGLGLI